jgi:ribosomal protein S18 acetylase RimI-like enzyme
MTTPEGTRLVRPNEEDAVTVAGWSRSSEESRQWCSVEQHPFPPDRVRRWWAEADVRPFLLVADGYVAPVGYGEVWVDDAEDEVELARLIIDPARRRSGLGRQLVTQLLVVARATGMGACQLRVSPDNAAALGLYRSVGFADVDPDRTAEWNRGQPASYVWFEWPDFAGEDRGAG